MTAVDTADSPSDIGNSSSVRLVDHVRELLRVSNSRQDFLRRSGVLFGRKLAAGVVRIDIRTDAGVVTEITHDPRMTQETAQKLNNEFLAPLAAEHTTDRSASEPSFKQFARGRQTFCAVGTPIADVADGSLVAIVTMLIPGDGQPEFLLPLADSLSAAVSAALSRVAPLNSSPNHLSAPRTVSGEGLTQKDVAAKQISARQLDAVSRTSQFSSVREFAYSLVNSLCGQFAAEQVFFGIVRNGRVTVEAVSGTADFKASGPGIVAVRQAMEECLDREEITAAQISVPDGIASLPLHRQLSANSSNAAVISVPLRDGDLTTAVVTLRRTADQPFRAADAEAFQKTLIPYGSAVRVLDRAGRPLSNHLMAAGSSVLQTVFRRNSPGWFLAITTAAIFGVWFLFGSITYRPVCRARVVAADLTHLSAPFSARLKNVYVKPGQHVTAGQLLAEFDTVELQLQWNALQRQISATTVELRQALAADDLAAAALARSRLTVHESQAATVTQQIRAARLTAPTNGTVMLADLEQRIGQTFQQGDDILQCAGGAGWLLNIEVPDAVAAWVASGQHGTFSAAAAPSDRRDFLVSQINGSATVVEDRNVFSAQASLQSPPDWIRNGMDGTVVIQTVPRPVWWVALHRVIDWARMTFWI
ncbi:MAG: efflux RND transporter periplasmic adaptor subunit [Planctomycetaceae bacterium]|nr:efflux RND transporter periplasmic adaptor subunit [Planctomycetaceae bacterium]